MVTLDHELPLLVEYDHELPFGLAAKDHELPSGVAAKDHELPSGVTVAAAAGDAARSWPTRADATATPRAIRRTPNESRDQVGESVAVRGLSITRRTFRGVGGCRRSGEHRRQLMRTYPRNSTGSMTRKYQPSTDWCGLVEFAMPAKPEMAAGSAVPMDGVIAR